MPNFYPTNLRGPNRPARSRSPSVGNIQPNYAAIARAERPSTYYSGRSQEHGYLPSQPAPAHPIAAFYYGLYQGHVWSSPSNPKWWDRAYPTRQDFEDAPAGPFGPRHQPVLKDNPLAPGLPRVPYMTFGESKTRMSVNGQWMVKPVTYWHDTHYGDTLYEAAMESLAALGAIAGGFLSEADIGRLAAVGMDVAVGNALAPLFQPETGLFLGRIFPWLSLGRFLLVALDLYHAANMPAVSSQFSSGGRYMSSSCSGAGGFPGSFYSNMSGVPAFCVNAGDPGIVPVNPARTNIGEWTQVAPQVPGQPWARAVAVWTLLPGETSGVPEWKRVALPSLAGHHLEGLPGLSPGQLATALPAIAPFIQANPEPLPISRLHQFDLMADPAFHEVSNGVSTDVYADVAAQAEAESRSVPGLPMGAVHSDFWTGQAQLVDPETETQVQVEVSAGGSGGNVVEVTTAPVEFSFGPFPKARDRKLKATPHAYVLVLALATVGSALVRTLFQSLPKDARSYSRSGKRRYDSMLRDVALHIDQVDWGLFTALGTEAAIRLGLMGYIGRQIDANRQIETSGFGLSTNIMHGYGPDPSRDDGTQSTRGGPFSNRLDPGQVVGSYFRALNRNAGLKYERRNTLRGR